jgi:hypothetical protein
MIDAFGQRNVELLAFLGLAAPVAQLLRGGQQGPVELVDLGDAARRVLGFHTLRERDGGLFGVAQALRQPRCEPERREGRDDEQTSRQAEDDRRMGSDRDHREESQGGHREGACDAGERSPK